AGVGRDPEEEVAGEEDSPRRPPEPRVVVGLTARVRELERDPADLEPLRVGVGHVGIVVLRRPRRRDRELPRVDQPVPGGRRAVPIEAPRDVAMADDAWAWPAVALRLVQKRSEEHTSEL